MSSRIRVEDLINEQGNDNANQSEDGKTTATQFPIVPARLTAPVILNRSSRVVIKHWLFKRGLAMASDPESFDRGGPAIHGLCGVILWDDSIKH